MNIIQDVMSVIGAVKDEFTSSFKPNSSNTLDYSFITPTLLALGKVNDINVDELIHVLQGQPALFWNLSGKPLAIHIPEKLNNQIIDNPWVTPGHFTQAPSLECVFKQCYSIKAWLDLKDDHIAVLHCGNGRYRTGILMACYLKYIGAFEKSSEAFDYFCGTRIKKDAIPTLSPSYRILFENVDRSTDYGGSPNPFPLHLKCLSISGLPVDEIPCVEVWDMSGLVFASHRGEQYDRNACSWSAEYGDGFYRVGKDIIGDFSVMCRFGGSHSLTRDKTTLIFKYQNSTAFLPPDVIELSKQNVDLNPEYADSLEDSAFSMHLMFDLVDELSMSKSEFRAFAESYQLRGKEAFESGLDEISKYHSVVPNNNLSQQLMEMKFPNEYITVALQLSNNDISQAISLMALLLARSQSLKNVKSLKPTLPESPYHVKLQKTSLGVKRSGEKARVSMQNLQIEDIKTKLFEDKKESRSRHRDNGRDKHDKDREKSSKREHKSSRSRSVTDENAAAIDNNNINNNINNNNIGDNSYNDYNDHHSNQNKPIKERNRASSEIIGSVSDISSLTTGKTHRSPPPPPTSTSSPSFSSIGTTSVSTNINSGVSGGVLIGSSNIGYGTKSSSSITSSATSSPATISSINESSNISNPNEAGSRDCGLCQSNEYSLRDQLVPCTKCGCTYHTKCFGGKRIPFSIKSIKERQNRDRYLVKYFSDWVCPICLNPKQSSTEELQGNYNLKSSETISNNNNNNNNNNNQSNNVNQIQGENIIGYVNDNGNNNGNNLEYGNSNSPNLGGDKASKSITSKLFGNFLGFARSQSKGSIPSSDLSDGSPSDDTMNPLYIPSGKVGFKQAGSPVPAKSTKTLSTSPSDNSNNNNNNNNNTTNNSNNNSQPEEFQKLLALLTSCGITVEALLAMSEEKQKETLISMTNRLTSGTSDNLSETQFQSPSSPSQLQSNSQPLQSPNQLISQISPSNSPRTPNSPKSVDVNISAELLQKLSKVDPRFAKYTKMFQVGLPVKTLEEKMKADGIDLALAIASLGSQLNSPTNSNNSNQQQQQQQQQQLFSNFSEEATSSTSLSSSDPFNSFPNSNTNLNQNTNQSATIEPKPEGPIVIEETDPRFSKYFQMIKLGLPKHSVAHKMCTDGATPTTELGISILDHKPINEKDLLATPKLDNNNNNNSNNSNNNNETSGDSKEDKPDSSTPQLTFIEHPEYSKFFRMLKAGIPSAAVKIKMSQEGLNPDFLDRSPNDIVPDLPKKKDNEEDQNDKNNNSNNNEGEMVALQDHPIYSKYFRMLKVGLPLPNVRAKMEQEGYDPSILEKKPTDMVPVEIKKDEPVEMVPLQDHPAYGKYLRMLKVGLPLVAAKQKMIDDGFDPTILDKSLTDLVPLDTNYRAPEPKLTLKKPAKSPAVKIRKKKLHWKALDKSRVGSDSVWAADEDDDGFQLDAEEFNQLFIQKEQKEAVKAQVTDNKKKIVNLVDPKRAQNAGIALARLKIPYVEVKDRIISMDDKSFSADQYTSLLEYLPTLEEIDVLKRYKGDYELLGPAEKYMMVMLECPDASKRIKCILFKQQFRLRRDELVKAIKRLEAVCDDVKMSMKLKKVLKTILKVGNQLNDGEDHMGFTVDSLLKLQSAKAFDKKTSILQYVVRLISRNDESCLSFPEDLEHLTESERLSIDQIMSEMNSLQSAYASCKEIVDEIADATGTQKIRSMLEFLNQVENQFNDINNSIEVMRTKYQSVLAYFGEEATLPSQEFFSTLEKFVKAFIEERELNERLRKAEEKKSMQERQRKTVHMANELDAPKLQGGYSTNSIAASAMAASSSSNLLFPGSRVAQINTNNSINSNNAPNANSPTNGNEKRRVGPNGAVVMRRNSSVM